MQFRWKFYMGLRPSDLHSSKKKGLCLMKWPDETLQNLAYFIYLYENSKLLFPFFILCYFTFPPNQGRQSGLKSGGAQRGKEFRGIFTPKNLLIYILSGRGRKSGGARALLAPPRMAPLHICYCTNLVRLVYAQLIQWQKINQTCGTRKFDLLGRYVAQKIMLTAWTKKSQKHS